MKEYRVTKYDPAFRDGRGAFTREEWTSYEDVGRFVTLEEYSAKEMAYITTAVAFIEEAGLDFLEVCGFENAKANQVSFGEGSRLSLVELTQALRSVLREEVWCRFEHPSGAFVHVGWEFYMYIAVPGECPRGCATAKLGGLFIEECRSPYREAG